MRRSKSPAPQKPQIIISAPFMVRREITPELQSILEVINGQSGGARDSFDSERLTTISEENGIRGDQNVLPRKSADSGTAGVTHRLRACFSSPDLRPETATRPRLSVRSKSPQPSRPRSVFSIGTQVIEGKRPVLRRMLDAGGCTKGESFDIHDFARVQPPKTNTHPIVSVTTTSFPAELEETHPRALREESWREGVRQMLYFGTQPIPTTAIRPSSLSAGPH